MNDQILVLPVVIAPYASWTPEYLGSRCTLIGNSVKSLKEFASIDQQVSDFIDQSAAFTVLVNNAKARDMVAIAEREEARKKMVISATALGNAVSPLANGDLALLMRTNLPLRRRRQKVTIVAPTNLRLAVDSVVGKLMTRVKGVKGKNSYVTRYRADDTKTDVTWIIVNCGRVRCTIYGLTSGARYWVQVGVVAGDDTLWGDTLLSPYIP